MSNDKMREEFEAAIAEEAGQPLVAIQLSRMADSYSTSALIYAWWAWQHSRKSLVIELPTIKNEDWACDSGECEAMRSGIRMSRHAINAAGIKVKPEPVHVDPHTCSACGAKGWSANCDQCIPF